MLMAKYAEPDTDWEQPWMSVEDWRPDNRSILRLFTLVVPRNFPRPMPCDVIRWALGALAIYITSEKCNADCDMQTGRRADLHVSNTWNQYGHIAQEIPKLGQIESGLDFPRVSTPPNPFALVFRPVEILQKALRRKYPACCHHYFSGVWTSPEPLVLTFGGVLTPAGAQRQEP